MTTAAGTPWVWTLHAWQRCREMGLHRDRVEAVLDAPDLDYPSTTFPGGERRIACAESLAVVYCSTDRAIITVLWHGQESRYGTVAA